MNRIFQTFVAALIVMVVLHISAASVVMAYTLPSFTSCLNPQGSIIASYSQGTHGIVGQSGTYQGSDTVYRLSDTAVTQCFCKDTGEGIQTDWFKPVDMSQDDITTLERLGWYVIPDGRAWGLDEGMYLARNTTYTCKGTGGSSQSSTSSSSQGGGQSDSASESLGGAVLGLAATGNAELIYRLWLVSLLLMLCGVSIKLLLRRLHA